MEDKHSPRRDAPRITASGSTRKVVRVEELLNGVQEAILNHGGEEYRLRITRNGKLILTK
ncbi:MAG: hemin uptake protein HemP [Planctomycetes bacterium]|nr:hemin uptake protein HemP [Planctomycetota bacterium]